MKIAILHLSDLHIDSKNYQWLTKKTKQIVSAVWNNFSECGKIVIVVSGDIAYSGKKEQYDYAKDFFRALLRAFAEKKLGDIELDNKIICVPGNHDCDFDINDNARKMLLTSIRSNAGMVDESVYNVISAVQNNFKEFAKDIMIDKTFSLSINNNVIVNAGDKAILFRLYNTAWMSSLKEEQNSIVMPLEMIETKSINADLVVSLFHHYYSWLTPSCEDNKNRFRKYIMKTSNMILYGHAHTPSSSQVTDYYESEIINEFEGGALYFSQPGCSRTSSFNSIILDLDSFECVIRSFDYSDNLYSMKKERRVNLNQERKMDEFRHNSDFLKSLKRMSIPIHNSENVKMTLDEFFVYPDLERINKRQLKVDEDFTDSSSIIEDSQYHLVMLEGDDQCGKTSLLNMYYLRFVDKYMYPIIIQGKNLINDNLDKIIGKAFDD